MLSLFEILRNDVHVVDSHLLTFTNELYLNRNGTDLNKLQTLYETRRRGLNEIKPWAYYFEMKFRYYLTRLPPPPTFMTHWHNKTLWEKLYDSIGEMAFEELSQKIPLFFKWGDGVYVQFSLNNEPGGWVSFPKKRKYPFNGSSILDVPIGRKRMFHSCHRKNSLELIQCRSVENLCKDILSMAHGTSVKELSLNKLLIKRIYDQHIPVQFLRRELCKLCKERIVPPDKTVEFVHWVIDNCIPPNLIGRENLETFKVNIKPLITSASHRVFLAKDLVQNFKMPTSTLKLNGIILVAMWLARTFVVELLSRVFVCLESSRRKEPIFFKSVAFRRFVRSCKRSMFALEQIEPCQLPVKDPRIAPLVPLPKSDGGFRPLVRQSNFLKHSEGLMEKCKIFLKQIVRRKKGRHLSVYSEIHQAWVNFTSITKNSKKVYYVKCDIEDAFGSINHKLLKSMLKANTKSVQEKTLHFQRFKVKDHPLAKSYGNFTDLPAALPKTCFIPSQYQEEVAVQKLVNAIFYFIDNIYIKVLGDKKIYRIVKGLPQGAKLSSVLCDLYCSYLDDQLTELYRPEEGDVFLRNVDDYIFMSSNKKRCQIFYRRIIAGAPHLGIFMKSNKTMTNLKLTGDETPMSQDLVYHGLVLRPEKRSIQWNFVQYGCNLNEVIALDSNMTWTDLERRMSNIGLLKLHDVLYDGAYLSKRQIMTNLFLISCVHALRYHFIVSRLTVNNVRKNYADEKVEPILVVSRKVASRLSRRKLSTVTYEALRFIVLRAFRIVLINSEAYRGEVHEIDHKASELKKWCGVRERKLLSECTKHCPSFVDPYF